MAANTIVVGAAVESAVVVQSKTKSFDTFRTVVGQSYRRFRHYFHRSNCCYNETHMSTLTEPNHNVTVSEKVTIVMIQHSTER